MSEHPDRKTLEAFLRSGLPTEQSHAVLRHLAKGCRQCQEAMGPYATAMFQPGLEEPELTPELDAAYDAAIASAFTRVLTRNRELIARQDLERKVSLLLRSPSLPEEPGFWTAALAGVLIEKTRELRHDDPAGMLRLARLAQHAADRVESGAETAETTDLRARAWAELANALRVNDELPQAEMAMARALELRAEGTGAPLLLARLADLSASLFCDQRRFAEAFRALDTAFTLYRQHGMDHDAGRMLVMKGLYTGYTGHPAEGLQLLARGLATIERERDPRLVFHTLHNMLLFRVELGELEEARRQLQRMQPLYGRYAGTLDRIKLRGIEGKIAAGLGDLARAEMLFHEVRRELDDHGLGYQAALISLDLASVCLRLGKQEEVRRLVAGMVATFRAVGVEREAMASLLVLGEAADKGQTTLEMLTLVSSALHRLQRGPGLLVRPEPA